MADNETHRTFEDILAQADGELGELCVHLRKMITGLHKQFVEIVWPTQKIVSYGVGPKKMTEHYAYIAVFKARVNLGFYHGATLPDPEGLLEGTGKSLRHGQAGRPRGVQAQGREGSGPRRDRRAQGCVRLGRDSG